jgi:hypothetical protein
MDSFGSGGHNVHRNDYFSDGAIVIDPLGSPHYYLFKFANQVFGDCTPECFGRECGHDGCGGSCEPGCEEWEVCNELGVCEDGPGSWQVEVEADVMGIDWLTGMHGFGVDDIWAVGNIGILHYIGGNWITESVPVTDSDSLNEIWGATSDSLHVAGDTSESYWNGLILNYVGGSWERDSYFIMDRPFFGIWGSASDDLWIVGYYGIIIHGDGDEWWQISYSPTSKNLWAIWGADPDDIHAVGANGAAVHKGFGGWSWEPSHTEEHLYDVWGSGYDDVWAVGNNGEILRYCFETGWSRESSPTENALYGVWGSGADDVWAVGEDGVILHFDGQSWSPFESPTTKQLNAIWGNGQGDIWAVGEGGVILRYE